MIKGKLIHLRAMEPTDVQFLYEIENDVNNWGISSTIVPFSRYTLNEFISRSSNDIMIDKQLRLIVMENATNQNIGTVDFYEYDAINSRCGIGILIIPEKRKKGFANEAILLSKILAFKYIQLHQIFCQIPVYNKDSLSLFKKNNFKKTAIKKHWLKIENKWVDVAFLQCFNPFE